MTSKRANIAVIGLGGRGRSFCDAFAKNPRSQLVAVCDLNPKAVQVVRAKHGDAVAGYTDAAEMLKRPDIDAVVVATHDKDHVGPAIQTLEAGKHCFLEKPMAQSIADCDAILRAGRKSGRVLMLGYELRHCVLFEEMHKIIQRGDIGAIKLANVFDNVSVGGNYFYHDKCRRREYIYNLLLQKACHSIDLLNWFVGAQPRRVFASSGLDVFGGNEPNDKRCRSCDKKGSCPYAIDHRRFLMDYGATVEKEDLCVYAKEVDVPDNSLLLIDYDNGVRATFTECHFTPEYTREFWLVGDKGKMYGFYNNECEFVIRVTYRHSKKVDEYRPKSPGGGHGGGDPRLHEHFLDCVLEGRQPDPGPMAGRDSAAIAIAAEESALAGAPVTIPPFIP